jgi:hypothetical protein
MKNAPALRGYVATTPKPQSTVLLASRQLDPVLSEWQYGLGRVMAWTSDVKNLWASRWLEWPDFARFWAQLVKRTDRAPEDPNRQITVKIDGDQARITLDAQTGSEQTDRQYLNFLSSQAVVVDPDGGQASVPLPQVAPGRYEATVPVQADGVYTLTATQTDASGGQAVVSSGFVVPYSPEYRLTSTDHSLLESLARSTGGKVVGDPADAFAHTLPAVGAPHPLWPWLLLATAILLVADVGVRRVRISAPELRAGYGALRRRLGYIDEQPGATRRSVTTSPARRVQPAGAIGLVTSATNHTQPTDHLRSRAPTVATQSDRLLAAKRRAARR